LSCRARGHRLGMGRDCARKIEAVARRECRSRLADVYLTYVCKG
jgi:hypothetical protein